LALSFSIFSGLRTLILVIINLKAAKKTHFSIINTLLHASITDFYDRIPLGRIFNRLTRDLACFENGFIWLIGKAFKNVYTILSNLVVGAMAIHFWIIPIVAIIC